MKLYSELASWFHLLTPPSDYTEEAACYAALMDRLGVPPEASLLELGAGGGNNASFLKQRFTLTLVDLSPDMLDQSRQLNPECEHVVGDMRSVRLNRWFDVVFVHDAVMYLTTQADLDQMLETAWIHLRPGGVLILVPDCTLETFQETTAHHGHDGSDGRSLRYLEWTFDPNPDDTHYTVVFSLVLKEASGTIRFEQDIHSFGVFSRAVWLNSLEKVGFAAHEEIEPEGILFVGQKPHA
ncbi:MAG: class I SAM-dependent methyltransferase [Acidobacteria bacterium]|nr:class I SAM-dependent methyltransferase [Acidobacteriota bacterium]